MENNNIKDLENQEQQVIKAGTTAWNSMLGNGVLVNDFTFGKDGYALLDFNKKDLVEFSAESIGKFLFLSRENCDFTDREQRDAEFKRLKELKKIADEEEKNRKHKITVRQNIEKFIPNDFQKKTTETFFLVYRKEMQIRKRNFLKLLIYSCLNDTLYTLVDTNGQQYGLHSYNDEFGKMKEFDFFRAEFIKVKDAIEINTLRITSPISYIEDGDDLLEIFRVVDKGKDMRINSFEEIFEFCNLQEKSVTINLVTRFSKTKLKRYKNKYQFKMNAYFADVIDDKFDLENLENYFYRGLAIVECQIIHGKNKKIRIKKLYGRFFENEEKIDEYIEDKHKKFEFYLDYINNSYNDETNSLPYMSFRSYLSEYQKLEKIIRESKYSDEIPSDLREMILRNIDHDLLSFFIEDKDREQELKQRFVKEYETQEKYRESFEFFDEPPVIVDYRLFDNLLLGDDDYNYNDLPF